MIPAVNYRLNYLTNGTATTFAYGFPVSDKNFVKVVKTDLVTNIETTLVVDTDYTVNGVKSDVQADWTLTIPATGTPLPTGSRLTVIPNLTLTQLTDFNSQGNFNPNTVEDSLDYLTLLCQQLQEQIGRAVLISPGDTTTGTDPDSFLAAIYVQVALATQQAVAAGASATAAAAQVVLAQGQVTLATAQAVAAAASAAAAAAAVASVQPFDTNQYAVATGTNTITATLSPAPTSYATGMEVCILPAAANTGAVTINLNSLGAKAVQFKGAALVGGEIVLGLPMMLVYDGTQFQVTNGLLPMVQSPVRQTVLGGPVDTNGFPTFLPSTAVALAITSQNVTSTAPFVVSSANGFGLNGAANRIGISTANLTWSSLTASNTNYLYVDIASNGTMSTGSTTTAPIYQFGGTRSTTSGQFTFNIQEMSATVGIGSAANQAYRVYVGEAVCSGSAVTSTVAYAYQGAYESGYTNTLPGSATGISKNHNIGETRIKATIKLKCITANSGYSVGEEVDNGALLGSENLTTPIQLANTRNVVRTTTGNIVAPWVIRDGSTGTGDNLTLADWAYGFFVKRAW